MNSDFSIEKLAGGMSALYWAVVFILIGLIYMTSSHIKAIWERRLVLVEKNRVETEWLQKAGVQARLAEKLKESLRKQALTDPVAARILADFYPPTSPPPPQVEMNGKPQ